METRKFRIFLSAVDTHDFAETGRNMFIFRSAVLQQISKLENELGVKLFERTTHEIKPTEAGKALIPLANKLVQTEDDIIRTMHNNSNSITIGTIYLQKPEIFTNCWNQIMKDKKGFENIKVNFQELHSIKEINNQVDLIEYYEINKFFDTNFAFKAMRQESIVIGIPKNNPLVKKNVIELSDLLPYEVAIEKEGISEMGDKVMDYIVNNYPSINLHSYGVYNSSFFTTAQFKQQLIIAASGMTQYMHPYVVKPLKLGIDVHALYGFYYRKKPSQRLAQFIDSL